MHGYSDSHDSGVNIRTNPLNIHLQDGSDLIIENLGPSQVVSTNKPVINSSPLSASSAQTAEFKEVLNVESNVSRHSICEPVMPLKLGKKKSGMSLAHISPDSDERQTLADAEVPEITDLSIPDFSPLVALDFENFSLNRQGTIKSQHPVQAGPSKSPLLFERIKSMRTHQPDPAADEPLPANLLRVIQFSPQSNFSETFSDSISLQLSDAGSPTHTPETEAESLKSTAEPEVAPQVQIHSPESESSVDHKSQTANASEHSPLQEDGQEENEDETVIHTPKLQDVTLESVEAAGTPDITVSDPITESDRGRLFMQIRKLESLRGVPIDPSRNPRFTLTLDNGIQTVTTPPVNLPSSKFSGTIHASIGQEFELVVGKDLELVITLNILMDAIQPPAKPRSLGATAQIGPEEAPQSPKSAPKSPSKMKSFFSPKRKTKQSLNKQVKEQIARQDNIIQIEREHDALMEEYRRKRDLWKGLCGKNGEYARGYLFESHYERDIYGIAGSYSLPLYNEWQGVDAQHMGDLELTLMFVPRLYGSESLPVSLASAQKALQLARSNREFNIDGYLTQNGGDCRVYRRRYMTLRGSEFIAHHEATHKVRAVIHMENAIQIIDATDVSPNDNMWCIYEDRSFLVVFSDGEEVSFYADTPEQKIAWVEALTKSMTFCTGKTRTWEDLVLDSFESK